MIVRDDTPAGFQVRLSAVPGYITVAAIGMDDAGNLHNFFFSTNNGPATIQV